ncbi:DNA-binding transcriptional regulator, MarR family [Pseudonocardia thermophila]|jgi:Transcriptional regulators|uniref:DNA-binding transcriptional regulator, MarR family n=1 Tax=Pseudonocardia thermophila TaxID=1848 RepID=A0A1M6NI55_PSETH|nr:MarR family winged helix-turn-helix transcriptional regulator [Pseudonocardia thermophila]SHJ95405.1 DNA-binding transcriptional regulator, MarR family [Pseudonocardia thermophila]
MPVDAGELYVVLRRVRPLHLLSARAVTAALAGEQVTMGVRALLEALLDTGPAPVPAIARTLSLPRQVIQRLVDQARGLGLVTTAPNPAHRRSPLVVLTDEGRAAFDRIHDAELRALGPIAAGLDPGDVAAAVRVLDALVTGIGRITADAPPVPIEEAP